MLGEPSNRFQRFSWATRLDCSNGKTVETVERRHSHLDTLMNEGVNETGDVVCLAEVYKLANREANTLT